VAADSVARASADRAPARRCREVQHAAARLWSATANPDGPGWLFRGLEFDPTPAPAVEHTLVVEALVRLARLSESVAEELRDCPDPTVRRSAAVLAARAHPILAGLGG
jgi:hypothetical protein